MIEQAAYPRCVEICDLALSVDPTSAKAWLPHLAPPAYYGALYFVTYVSSSVQYSPVQEKSRLTFLVCLFLKGWNVFLDFVDTLNALIRYISWYTAKCRGARGGGPFAGTLTVAERCTVTLHSSVTEI